MSIYSLIKGRDVEEIDWKITRRTKGKHKGEYYSDCRICFDIETTSAFEINGKLESFDVKKAVSDESYRKEVENSRKFALCYAWSLTIDDTTLIGRTIEDAVATMSYVQHVAGVRLIIYSHFLGFEFQFLRNVMKIDSVFARKARRVMTFESGNIEFRCSYFLTRYSLYEWGKQKKLRVRKLVGDLDYHVIRTPLTRLTRREWKYIIRDTQVVVCGLEEYLSNYGHIWAIPLTQTGTVRVEVRQVMRSEIGYRKKMATLQPATMEMYAIMCKCAWGGSTGASYLYSGLIEYLMDCWDISSSYPWCQLSEMYPMSPFISFGFDNSLPGYWLLKVKYASIRSRYYNSFLSVSHCEHIENEALDNGKVLEGRNVIIYMTSVDYEIFKWTYDVEGEVILESYYSATKGYLNDKYRRYLLDLYNRKTLLKGDQEQYPAYMDAKEKFNSNFGMTITREFTDEVILNDFGEWKLKEMAESDYDKKYKRFCSKLTDRVGAYQHGIFTLAFARRNLWKSIIATDVCSRYHDTDSNKLKDYTGNFFEEYNAKVRLKQEEIAQQLDVDISLFRPAIPGTNKHVSIGEYDHEGTYDSFVTLGAKKYAYVENGELHITVAGVPKSGVKELKRIENFTLDFRFTEKTGKSLLTYLDNMDVVTYNEGKYDEFISSYQYGICSYETSYTLGMTPEYADLILENLDERSAFLDE